MPRTSCKFTQADVARVLRAVNQTGVPMEVLIEKDGRIRIVPHSDNDDPSKSEKVDSAEVIRL